MKSKKSLIIIGVALIIFAPLIASAGLVPCGGTGASDTPTVPCNLCHLFTLVQKILNFLAWIIAPTLAVLVIAVGGFKIMLSGPKPGLRNEGINAIKIAITGLLIVSAAWVVINETLLFFTNTTVDGAAKLNIANMPLPWHKIECVIPKVIITPPITPLARFTNVSSPELATLISCIAGKVSGLRITSITDNNIGNGLCDPMDLNESFNDSNNCQHAQYSCHYGGQNCASRGSFAFDFGTQVGDPSFATMQTAILQCNSGAFVQYEGNPPHGHASIGTVNGCGCN